MARDTKFTIVHVTEHDISAARQADAFALNPLSIAIKRQLGRTMCFGWDYVHYYPIGVERWRGAFYQMQSIRVRRALDKFRNGKGVKPFSFVLYNRPQQMPGIIY